MSEVWAGRAHQAVGAAIGRLLIDRAVEPAITAALMELLPDGTRLHGLEARMKSPASTADKVARKRRGDEPATETVGRFTDTLRYTVCTQLHDAIVPVARQMLAGLVAQGMTVIEASETYRDGADYKGLHFLVRVAETVFEMQLHSELSQRVKDQIHPYYEVTRSPDVSDAEVDAAQAECVKRSATVPIPAGLDKVQEFGGCTLQHR